MTGSAFKAMDVLSSCDSLPWEEGGPEEGGGG